MTSGTKGRVTPRGANVVAMMAAAFLVLILLVLHVASAGAAPACADDFTGPAGGDWSTPAYWTSATDASDHAVPGNLEVVCLEGTDVVVNSAADADSVQGQGGGIQLNGGSLTLFSTSNSSTIGSLEIDQQSTLTAPASQTVTVTGNIEWGNCSCNSQQNLSATIDQTAGPSGSLDIDGPGGGLGGPIFDSGSITSNSPITISNPAFDADAGTAMTTTSTITLATEVQMLGNDPSASFTAAGVVLPAGIAGFGPASLTLTGGTTTIGTNKTLWAGAVTLQGGVLQDDGGLQEAPGRTESLTITGGTLDGVGNMQGPVTNVSGTVTPGDSTAGTLTMSGTYTQDGGGTLDIGIGASNEGLLQVSGPVNVAGTLIANLGSFMPQQGQLWVVVASLTSTFTGTFTITGPGSERVSPIYLPRSLELGTAQPGTTTTTTTTTTTGTGTGTGTTTPGTTTNTGTTVGVNGQPVTGTTGTSPTDSTSTTPPGCVKPSGRLSATAIGRIALGETRASARKAITRFTTHGGIDDFCLSGAQLIKAGYASGKQLHGVSKATVRRLSGRIVLATTTSTFYALGGVRPGAKLTAAAIKHLHLGKPVVKLGSETWYAAQPAGPSRGVLAVSGGRIKEIGIANAQLIGRSTASASRFLRSFGAGA
jgi:hypothetical protein